MGSIHFPLSEQIANTIAEHGRDWAEFHYCYRRTGPRLSALEWRVLSRGA